MKRIKDFTYHSSNGLLNVNTLSPTGAFYRVKQPKELNKPAFGCKIAFYDKNASLIYHRSEVYAHELHSKEEIQLARQKMEMGQLQENEEYGSIEIVKWSEQGNLAYFLEYTQQNYKKLYDSVFLNLKEQFCYRIDELQNDFEIVDSLHLKNLDFDEMLILKRLENLGLKQQEPIINRVFGNNLYDRLFFHNQWFPK